MKDSAGGHGARRSRTKDYPERRETLVEWPVIVSYDVPPKALRVTGERFDGTYLWYTRGVRGGGVPTHLYGGTQLSRRRGTAVAAKAVLKCKFFKDGRTVDYLDLEITSKEPTHNLVFVPEKSEFSPEHSPTYTHEIGRGLIAIVPRQPRFRSYKKPKGPDKSVRAPLFCEP